MAEASCTESFILVGTPPIAEAAEIWATWRIRPACDVIETGLLVGRTADALVPADEPVYGWRDVYSAVVTAGEGGSYWVAAYARDEDGNIIQSQPRSLLVVPAPMVLPGRHGSHGTPPSYTGTDQDFLVQAGEPHFASLRRLHAPFSITVDERWDFPADDPYVVPTHGSVGLLTGSTNASEVRSALDRPLTIGSFTQAPEPGVVDGMIADLTQGFQTHQFPRPGFYAGNCALGIGLGRGFLLEPTLGGAFIGPLRVDCMATPGSPHTVRWRDQSTHDVALGFEVLDEITVRWDESGQSVTYLIPRLAPGRRLVSATLPAVVTVLGDISAVRLNGKSPTASSLLFPCSGGPILGTPVLACSYLATWDFTSDVSGLTGSGGEFTVTFDPGTTGFDVSSTEDVLLLGFPGTISRSARGGWYRVELNVDYPWSHEFGQGSLALVTAGECARELKLTVTPGTVRPQLPDPPSGELAQMPFQADVSASVMGCAEDAGTTVAVTLEVTAPTPGTADDAGHVHGPRPLTAFGGLDDSMFRNKTASCVASLNATGTGSCTVMYFASEVSGVETVTARAPGFNDGQAEVRVKVPGLVNLADTLTNFFRLTGAQSGLHVDNHWGSVATTQNIQLVALDFYERYSATLGINDMSLPSGGLFDICGKWDPRATCPIALRGGHRLHRTGTSVDIDTHACVDPGLTGACNRTVAVAQQVLAAMCAARGQGFLAREATNHCEWRR